MQEFPITGGSSNDARAAPRARPFATFKLATPSIEIVQLASLVGWRKAAANINRGGLVPNAPDCPRPAGP